MRGAPSPASRGSMTGASWASRGPTRSLDAAPRTRLRSCWIRSSPMSVEYPARWESDVVLADGGVVHLRPIRNEDADALLGLYSRLSSESLYLRFFSPVPAPTARQLEALTDLDYDRRFALVAQLRAEFAASAPFRRPPNPPPPNSASPAPTPHP